MRSISCSTAALRLIVLMLAFSTQEASRGEPPRPNTKDTASLPHLERPDDPFDPIQQRARMESAAPRAPVGSVQVNVTAGGLNIVGDAANEPSIAIDPNDRNRMVIGWRQFNTVTSNFRQAGWAYTADGGQTWTFPGVLQPGIFRSDPVLGADGFGRLFYSSLLGTFCIDVWLSQDAGVTWPTFAPAFGGDKQWMDVDQRTFGRGAGHLYQSWSFGGTCQGGGIFNRSTDNGATWEEPIPHPVSSVFGSVAVGPDGEVYVAGVDFPAFFNDTFVVLRSDDAKNPNVTPTFSLVVTGNFLGGALTGAGAPNPGGLMGQVWIAVNQTAGENRGHVYMLCSVDPPGDDPMDVMFSRSTDRGQTWSAPVRVNDDSTTNGAWQWFGTMSVAPNGRIDAIWNDTRDDPNNVFSSVYYAYSTDEGATWTTNTAMTPQFNSLVGFPNQNKLGDYYDMESDLFGASLAYAATFNDEQDIYFMRILVDDCNTNGVPDAQDILDMTSIDCNGNGVPDECEADCNGNGIPDECDILSEFSSDCNANGVPDECEPNSSTDCNGNGIPDLCDIFFGNADCNDNQILDECEVPPLGVLVDCNQNLIPDECESQADCNTNGILDICDLFNQTSFDCDSDGILNECQLDGTHVLFTETFEGGGLPLGWSATGLWHTTTACARPLSCSPTRWAYYGQDTTCNYNTGAANSGVLTAPPIEIPENALSVTLRYCSTYSGQAGNSNTSGLDWAWLAANGVEVDDVSLAGGNTEWTTRTVDLSAFAGQTVNLTFHFDTRTSLLNTFFGWQVDSIVLETVLAGSLDCDDNLVPDACEIDKNPALDCNKNGTLDVCEAPVDCPCPTIAGDMNTDATIDGLDIQGFIPCRLAGDPTTPDCNCADMDESGVIDDTDAESFVECLLGLGCP